ncbi:MAG: sigma-70 family RNA polymerase sigma factor [Coriobacteriia bacterium]|nr:sigma-70 family RNA polymerase sigma factor [Coriobacteriia bacterium]MBS5478141.1 sigma-70 family RNA polymerase sigma factor [Coriobacteriia bacterium]
MARNSRRFATGRRDDAFLLEAMRLWGPSVYRLAAVRTGSHADADDVYQDVFLRLACDDTAFADDEHLKAWLLRVTINRCRELGRFAWKRRTTPMDALLVEPIDPGLTPEETLIAAEENARVARDAARLWRALARLKPAYREVIHLAYYENLTSEQIAGIVGSAPSTVRTRLQRARAKLRTLLEGASR